jgi:hypothetical protein
LLIISLIFSGLFCNKDYFFYLLNVSRETWLLLQQLFRRCEGNEPAGGNQAGIEKGYRRREALRCQGKLRTAQDYCLRAPFGKR